MIRDRCNSPLIEIDHYGDRLTGGRAAPGFFFYTIQPSSLALSFIKLSALALAAPSLCVLF
jgi:hypothetical protein